MICPYCGAKCNDSAAFCPNCGSTLKQYQPPAPPAPSNNYGNRGSSAGYGNPSGGYNNPSNGYGNPSGGYNNSSNGYGNPSGGYNNPSNGYGNPSGGYNNPSNGYGNPSGGYNKPSNGYGNPSGGYNNASNGYGNPSGGYNVPSKGYGNPSGGYGGGYSSETLETALGKINTAALIWTIIAVYQLVFGLFTICIGYGIASCFFGGWNLVQSSKMRKNVSYFRENPQAMVPYYNEQQTMIIVFLFLNLFLGGLLGVIGSIYELTVSSYIRTHAREF